MGKIINKIKKGVATGLVGVLLACPTLKANSMNLEIKSQILNQTPTCVEGKYNARWDSNNGSISNGYDANDVQEGSTSGSDYVQMYSIDTGYPLTEDYRIFDPTDSNSVAYYPIELMATEGSWMGFTGTNRTTITDANELDNVPSNYDVFLLRYDRNDNFVTGYDLRDPNNNTIEWEVSDALGKYGALDLHIAEWTSSDINRDGTVNFIDYSYFAKDWLKEEAGLDGDLDEDGDCDYNDLQLFTEDWLRQIGE